MMTHCWQIDNKLVISIGNTVDEAIRNAVASMIEETVSKGVTLSESEIVKFKTLLVTSKVKVGKFMILKVNRKNVLV